MICTYHSNPAGPGLDREQLYWELSQGTHDITQLGPYTLDEESLYVNGEGLWTFLKPRKLHFLSLLSSSVPVLSLPA